MSDFYELNDAIDACLEFGSMGQKRMVRVGEALKKKLMPKYQKGYAKALKTSVHEADRVGNKILAPLSSHRARQMVRAQDSANRSLKKQGKMIPRWDPRAVDPKTIRKSDALINRRAKSVQLSERIDDQLCEFADRKRDGDGRYAAGHAGAGVDDFRAAHGARKRKLLKRGAVIGGLAGAGALVTSTKMGRGAASRLGASVVRGVTKVAARD